MYWDGDGMPDVAIEFGSVPRLALRYDKLLTRESLRGRSSRATPRQMESEWSVAKSFVTSSAIRFNMAKAL